MTKWIVALMMSGLTLAAAPPDPAAVKEVLAANDALKQAMMKKDTAGVQKYLHDDLIYEHSHGQNQTKAYVGNATKVTRPSRRSTSAKSVSGSMATPR